MSDGAFNPFAFRNAIVDGGTWAALSGTARSVLYCYERHADGDGRAWPGRETLEAETGMTERNCRRGRAELAARGVLTVETMGGGRGKSTVVRLILPSVETGAQGAPLSENGGAGRPETGAQDDRKPGRQVSGNRGARRPQNNTEQNKEHTINNAGGAGGGDVVFQYLTGEGAGDLPGGAKRLTDRYRIWPELASKCARVLTLDQCRAVVKRVTNTPGVKNPGAVVARALQGVMDPAGVTPSRTG